ncbi:MAG TPA: DNA polymerase III subunit delta [Xanthobacteraceae bacterium]
MVAVKSGNADAFLAKADRLPDVVLIFGEDSGLVSERVRALIRASVDDPDDPFSLVRLDGDEIAGDPARLLDETQTIPLFGGRRAVWVRAGGRNFAPAVEAVLALPKSECRVVIEAGDLRRTAPLRAVCERAKNAAAVPCYADNQAALERLIDTEMRNAGLSLKPDARALLVTLLGGDRASSRSEIGKLILYAHGRAEIDIDDVKAVVSDATDLALDELVDTAFAGCTTDLDLLLGKMRDDGTSLGSIFFAVQRQLAQLHKWRTAMESGELSSVDRAMPPVHFSRKELVEAALKHWSAARLGGAMTDLADAVLASRKTPAVAQAIAERALLSIARQANAGAARRSRS